MNPPSAFAQQSLGGADVSKNYLNFMDLPKGVHTIPNPIDIETGTTLGVGAGTNVGYMYLLKLYTEDGLLPDNGL
jgi:hypothetical protein